MPSHGALIKGLKVPDRPVAAGTDRVVDHLQWGGSMDQRGVAIGGVCSAAVGASLCLIHPRVPLVGGIAAGVFLLVVGVIAALSVLLPAGSDTGADGPPSVDSQL